MKIAFTICSNNYYAQALTLAKSCKVQDSDVHFVIVLVDEPSSIIDYLPEFEHIFIYELPIDWKDIVSRYNIIELNTSVKPSAFLYLIKKYPHATWIHYFDPDIKLYAPLSVVEEYFEDKEILLTPHIFSTIPYEEGSPVDHLFLNFGIYNLGYLGMKVSDVANSMLKWWERKTLKIGYSKVCEGLFVDQLWMNHVPIFFHGSVAISFNPGMNAAPWNLHERKIFLENGEFRVSDQKLLFYHFSNYNYKTPDKVSKYYRYTFNESPGLQPLYHEYHDELLNNKVEKYSDIQCTFYPAIDEAKPRPVAKRNLKFFLKQVLPPVLVSIGRRALR